MALELDLRGIKCPLNWAHAKVRLEGLLRGEVLELIIDDPRGVRDIPHAAESEGHVILAIEPEQAAWRLKIEK